MKMFLSIVGGILIIVILLFGIFLFYINFTDYSPEPMEELQTIHRNAKSIYSKDISLISWNIGYAGLGKEMDFFYDGGTKVRADKALSDHYLQKITEFMSTQEKIDFWLLQEVDFKAKRSYYVDQVKAIAQKLPDFNYVTAINYNVPFVPVPISEPMGFVKAGMMSLSQFSPRLSRRYSYPQIAGWPDRMFLLDRGFIETRFPISETVELVIINTHNSAFVDDQFLMDKELAVIHDKMVREYELGNYVIAAGDWNMNPPSFRPEPLYNGHRYAEADVKIPDDFLPIGWKIAYDASVPTNRNLVKAFQKGDNTTTTLDYFIVSPNVYVNSIQTIDLDFEFSDHNPVKIEVSLR